jgi:4Fe-4S single cluster domain of Ferredoxin I
MWESISHPANVPGDFYVEDNCCTMCGVPFAAAPELFGEEGGQQCFVKRQPVSTEEFNQMFEAIRGAELSCIRYRGRDPQFIQRLVQLGEYGQVFDHPPAQLTDSQ